MCVFEILHFLPLALIAASFAGKMNKVAVSVAVLALSLVGLFAGDHMHHEHAEAINLIDPCLAYAAAALLSVVSLAQSIRAKFVNA